LGKRWLTVAIAGLALATMTCSMGGEAGGVHTATPAGVKPTQEVAASDEEAADSTKTAAGEPTPPPEEAAPAEEAGTGGDSGNPGGEIPAEERVATLREVTDFLNALPGADPAADNQTIADHLAARPEFKAAGVSSDGTVWGEFNDGRLFLVFNNLDAGTGAEDGPPDAGRGLFPPFPLASIIAPVFEAPLWQPGAGPGVMQGATGGLPKSDRAHVLSAMGTYYTSSAETRGKLESWLSANGYQLAGGDATVDELKAVKGDGVFYFTTHGGDVGNFHGEEVYALWTSTRIDAYQETLLRTDLEAGRVAYAAAPQDRNPAYDRELDADCKGDDCVKPYLYATHYAITPEFVKEYMSFAGNSLVFIDACSSDTDAMKQAFRSKPGVSLYAGWTQSVRDGFSAEASRFFFDGLLGTNQEPPEENPKVRPFDQESVREYMQRKNKVSDPGTGARLNFTASNPGFAILRPSIHHLEVKEDTDELFIFGMFGSEEGEVLIDGVRTSVSNWQPDLVVADLLDEGPGSAGDVVVKVREQKSNVVPLTEWRGQMRYTANADTMAPNLNTDVDMKVHFRADVHAYRDEPWEEPQDREVRFALASDSHAPFSMSGSSVRDEAKFELTGSGDLPVMADQPDHEQSHFDLMGMLHVQGITEGKPPDITDVNVHMHVDENAGKLTITFPNGMVQETPWGIPVTGVLFDQTMTLDENYNILEGHLESNSINGMPTIGMSVLEWDQLDAHFTPSLSDPPQAWQPLVSNRPRIMKIEKINR
jgi:hypothetical protein